MKAVSSENNEKKSRVRERFKRRDNDKRTPRSAYAIILQTRDKTMRIWKDKLRVCDHLAYAG
jgi:hypothetical protein